MVSPLIIFHFRFLNGLLGPGVLLPILSQHYQECLALALSIALEVHFTQVNQHLQSSFTQDPFLCHLFPSHTPLIPHVVDSIVNLTLRLRYRFLQKRSLILSTFLQTKFSIFGFFLVQNSTLQPISYIEIAKLFLQTLSTTLGFLVSSSASKHLGL